MRLLLTALTTGLVMAIGCGKPAQPPSTPAHLGDRVTKPGAGPIIGEGQKFSPPEKDYVVSLPSVAEKPKERNFGELRQLMIHWTDETGLSVAVRPYDQELIKKFTPTQLLEKAGEDLVETYHKQPRSNKPLTRSGHMAREMEFEDSKTSYIRILLCVANENLYQIIATGPKAVVTSEQMTRFFDSFEPIAVKKFSKPGDAAP